MLQHRLTILLIALVSTLGVSTGLAQAHSAEQGFILLLPTNIYITAGTLAVVASMVLMSILSLKTGNDFLTPRPIWMPSFRIGRIVSLASTTLLFILVIVGLFGPRDPLGNLMPLFIWSVWWIGFLTIIPICGDVWRWLNPWTGIYDLLFKTHHPPLTMPKVIGIWPALIVFLAFHGFALADIAPSDPTRLTRIVAGYWAFTFVGMSLFGAKPWLIHVECFSILFKLLGSLAPIQASKLGWPGWATMQIKNKGFGLAGFCVVMLAAGSFDGLHETFWWLAKIGINPLEFPGRSAVIVSSTLGLIAMCAGLGIVFTTSIWIGIKLAGNPGIRLKTALPLFALSLTPIAYGYHVAHFLTSFLVNIQYAAVAASDPLANGSNYFGHSNHMVTTGFLSDPVQVKNVWLTQASVVVASHILAVVLAHSAASKLYKTTREILLSQSAISLLMIAYTVFGLWLLASPRGV